MLIADQFFLLTTEASGAGLSGTNRKLGLLGAAVADLERAGRVVLGDRKNPKVTVLSAEPFGHRLHDALLRELAGKNPRKMSRILSSFRIKPVREVGTELAARGVVGVEPSRWGGLRPERYPELDPIPEMQLRSRLRAVFHREAESAEEERLLLSILYGASAHWKVLHSEAAPMGRMELRRVLKDLSRGERIGEAIRFTIAANTAASSA